MAYTDIDKPDLYFNTLLRNGTGSSVTAITGVGFQPDWIWQKRRDDTSDHHLTDSVRGATKLLYSSSTSAEQTNSGFVQSIDSDGFTMGANDWPTSATVVAWNWLAGGTASSNTDGSITSTVSANTTSGFSIVSYTGTGSASTIGHDLGTTPSMIIVKKRSVAGSWYVYHQSLGNTKRLVLDTTSASTTDANAWNNTSPTSSVFSVGASGTTNASGATHIAYCFAEKKGFSKFGSFTGNGNADGPFIYTGFKPAMVIIKRTNTTSNWVIFDNKRGTYNSNSPELQPNTSAAEASVTDRFDFLSNGIKFVSSSFPNGSGDSIIYMAFAENPLVGTNNIPATAR
jgi:hypothetical protein